MQMGEFDVIKELLEAHPAAKIGKAQARTVLQLLAKQIFATIKLISLNIIYFKIIFF